MNLRNSMKGLLVLGLLVGLLWWWWRATAPVQSAPPKVAAKSAAQHAFSLRDLKITAIPDRARPMAAVAATNSTTYAAAVTAAQPSLPDSASLTLRLDQAEHHMFSLDRLPTDRLPQEVKASVEASIVSYYHDAQGRELISIYVWQSWQLWEGKTIDPYHGSYLRESMNNLDEQGQDYVHKWARQQAAAAAAAKAATPATPPADPEADTPAPAPAQQGPQIIMN